MSGDNKESDSEERVIESVEELRWLRMNDELLWWGPKRMRPRHSPCLFDTTPLVPYWDDNGLPTGGYGLRASCALNGWVLNLDGPGVFPIKVRRSV